MVHATNALLKYMPDWYLVVKSGGSYFRRQSYLYMARFIRGRAWSSHKHARNRYHYYQKGENFFASHKSRLRLDVMRSRIAAGCEEHNYQYSRLISTLPKINIFLNRQSLATLAIYEPQAFKSLVQISKEVSKGDHDPILGDADEKADREVNY